ncbi:MAG TPA: tetratricopeptide repeat protein [Bryobacteraceae bacterium]|nr:tetratricopeptide repeat protein [Bryobacteraceae bacterium]
MEKSPISDLLANLPGSGNAVTDPFAAARTIRESIQRARDALRAKDYGQVRNMLGALADRPVQVRHYPNMMSTSQAPSVDASCVVHLIAIARAIFGQASLAQQNSQEAANLFETAVAELPVTPEELDLSGEDYADLAVALEAAGRRQVAISYWRQAVSRGLQYAVSLLKAGTTLMEAGLVGEAQEAFRKSVHIHPSAAAFEKLAEATELQNDAAAAAPMYTSAAQIALSDGDAAHALELVNKALESGAGKVSALGVKAQVLHNLGRYEEAVQAAGEALALDPDSIPALLWKSFALGELKDWENALQACQHILSLQPGMLAASLNMARVVYELGRKEEAAQIVEDAVKDTPGVPDGAYAGLAAIYVELNEADKAIAAAGKALEINPNNLQALTSKTMAMLSQERLEESLPQLDRMAELATENRDTILYTRGIVLEGLERLEESIASLRAAREYNPSRTDVLERLAKLLARTGDTPEAIEIIDQLLVLEPERTDILAEKARLLILVDKCEEARQYADRALARDPGNYLALFVRGLALFGLSLYEEALAAFDACMSLDDGKLAAAWKGKALNKLNRHAEAAEVLGKLVEQGDEDTSVLRALSESLIYSGKPDDAAQLLRQLVAQHPDAPEYVELLSQAFEKSGRINDALQHLDTYLAGNPRDTLILGCAAKLLRQAGRAAESATYYERLADVEPENLSHLQNLATALLSAGSNEKALEAVERALRLEPESQQSRAYKAEILRVLNRFEECFAACDALLAENPNNDYVLATKGTALRFLDRTEEALECLNAAVIQNPANDFARLNKAHALCDAAEFNVALDELDQVSQQERETGTYYWILLGWALENLGRDRTEEALRAYDYCVSRDPEDIYSRRGRADMYRRLGKTDRAAEDYEWLIRRADSQAGTAVPDLLAMKGWSMYGLGRPEDGVKFLVDALSLDPSLISSQFDLGLIFLCCGRAAVALREYQRGIDLTNGKTPARRKGLLSVAVRDLRDALADRPELERVRQVRQIREMLQSELRPRESAAAQ